MHDHTFSIVARCPDTGQMGVAISTAVPGVGGRCPYAIGSVGAVSTQAQTNPYLGIYVLELLRRGHSAQHAVRQVIAWDPQRNHRQLLAVDASGESAAFTGSETVPWAGHLAGPGYAVAGNMLVGEQVVKSMAEAFSSSRGPLADRLMMALEAGHAAGGDKRGRVSAALLVVGTEEYPLLRLHVDMHTDPVKELRRIYAACKDRFLGPDARIMRRSDMLGAP